jgi:hypothetical protein
LPSRLLVLALVIAAVVAVAIVLIARRGRDATPPAPNETRAVNIEPAAAPPPPPAAVAQPAAPKTPPPPADVQAAVAKMTEAVLMTRLREIAGSDPEGAVKLARAGNLRFPDSADAPERASILIHALAELGQASKARGEAEYAVNHYPDGKWVREIEGFTGAHRHRNLRVNDAGTLEYAR